ncbi:LAQU0S14e02300g1_1 [Lachancea quebecensis]|uniref:LAQU0S14e02300g1_1 n=1 Tax=Lachancea quebecensis TaxID=1654605 RepID=A0A0N7MM60_9SACH|nr:LAQU0S14e02300g1_1 [Lachancea quebecensis]
MLHASGMRRRRFSRNRRHKPVGKSAAGLGRNNADGSKAALLPAQILPLTRLSRGCPAQTLGRPGRRKGISPSLTPLCGNRTVFCFKKEALIADDAFSRWPVPKTDNLSLKHAGKALSAAAESLARYVALSAGYAGAGRRLRPVICACAVALRVASCPNQLRDYGRRQSTQNGREPLYRTAWRWSRKAETFARPLAVAAVAAAAAAARPHAMRKTLEAGERAWQRGKNAQRFQTVRAGHGVALPRTR